MNKTFWFIFAIIVGLFNAIAVAAAMLVICPEISQASAIAWIVGGFASGFFIAQKRDK